MKRLYLFLFLLFSLQASADMVCFSDGGITYWCYRGEAGVSHVSEDFEGDVIIIPSYAGEFERPDFGGYVTTIYWGSIINCPSLTCVTIPSSVTTIGSDGPDNSSVEPSIFYGCGALASVICNAEVVPQISKGVFENEIVKYATLYVPSSSLEDYKKAEEWNKFYDIVAIPDGSVTTHTLRYFVNGKMYKTYKMNKGSSITPEDLPQKAGHTFSGWTKVPETMPEYDIVVKGSFKVNTYKLMYIVDGENYKSFNITYGSTITPQNNPTKEGYTFSGWNEIPSTMPDHDVTVTGNFFPNTYKLTYIVDGEEYRVVEVKCDAAITVEACPTKKGMTFSGWSNIPEKMPAKDVTITGTFSWSKNTVDNVTYEVSDTINNYCKAIGNESASGAIKIAEAVDFDYSYNVATITDNTFNGCKDIMSIEIPATVTAIGERAFANIDHLTDVTIYAKNVPETDRTAFENSYTEDYVTLHVPAGSLDKYKAAAPWKNFKEIVAIEGTEAEPAKYTLIYQVDGETYQKYELEEGAEITALEEPTKEGYTFSGWDNVPETMPAEDVTIKGTFTVNKYLLIYMVDDEIYKKYDVEYGSEITAEKEPEKEGYTFSGWGTIPENMPAKDVIIKGTFTRNAAKEEEKEEVDTGEDVIKITSAGQTTWCSKYDLDFTDIEGLKAYIAPGYDRESGTIWLMRVFKVPAGEGILLMGDAKEYKVPHKPTSTYYTNMFVGTTEPKTIYESEGEFNNYYLSSGTSGVGFYRVTDAEGVQLKANRAYLPLKTSTQASTRGFVGMDFGEDGTTGMRNLTPALSKCEGVYYNLQGQRVDKPGKGLYILNGKKVVIR